MRLDRDCLEAGAGRALRARHAQSSTSAQGKALASRRSRSHVLTLTRHTLPIDPDDMPLTGTIDQRRHLDDMLIQPAGTPVRQAERYMISRVIAGLGRSMTYNNSYAQDYCSRNPSAHASSGAGVSTVGAVGISADSVQEATSYRGSVHAVARQSPILDSTYQYIPPDDPKNRSPRVTTYALDGPWYVEYLRKGLTETASRYRIDTERKKRLNLKPLQADVREASPAQKQYIRTCSTRQALDEAAYQQMIDDVLQMSAHMSKRRGWAPNDYNYLAQLYRCILTIQRQTIQVEDGQRIIQVSYTGATTGRIYTRESGLQSLPRYYKAQLLPGTNYDLKSAHDMILRYLFDRYGVPCPTWPNKDDIDLPNRLVKPISHAIKQVGAYQIPNHPKHCYAMKQQGCDVAREIVAYCNATGTLVEPVLDTLHAAFDNVEHAIAELESRIEGHVGEHPLDMPLQEGKGKVAWLLQGYEAAIVLPICEVLGSALVLADHDGFIVDNTTADANTEAISKITDEVVPKDLKPFVELRQKPLYSREDEDKVRRLTGKKHAETARAEPPQAEPSQEESSQTNEERIPDDLYFRLHNLYDRSVRYLPGTDISSRLQRKIDACKRQLSPDQLKMIQRERAQVKGSGLPKPASEKTASKERTQGEQTPSLRDEPVRDGSLRNIAEWVARQDTHREMLLGDDTRVDKIADAHDAARYATCETEATVTDWVELIFVIAEMVAMDSPSTGSRQSESRRTFRVHQIRRRLSKDNAYHTLGITTAGHEGYVHCHGHYVKTWETDGAAQLLRWARQRRFEASS